MHVTASLQSAGFHLSAVGQLKMKRWEADYVLEELDKLHLFDEYIEMSEYVDVGLLLSDLTQ